MISALTSKVPHPLFAKCELRVQTDGEKTPRDAVKDCAQQLIADLGQLSREFTKEFELRKMVAGDGSSANPTDK
jgi:DNA-directed RNA polymerase II subunit RPB11